MIALTRQLPQHTAREAVLQRRQVAAMSTTRKVVDGERDSDFVLGDELHTMSDQNTQALGGVRRPPSDS